MYSMNVINDYITATGVGHAVGSCALVECEPGKRLDADRRPVARRIPDGDRNSRIAPIRPGRDARRHPRDRTQLVVAFLPGVQRIRIAPALAERLDPLATTEPPLYRRSVRRLTRRACRRDRELAACRTRALRFGRKHRHADLRRPRVCGH